MKATGRLVDIHSGRIYHAVIHIKNRKIKSIEEKGSGPEQYLMPGLIDSHVHIESSMITPGAFASIAVKHGTIGTISDPHEIANVLGMRGVEFMIEDGRKVPFYFWFGAPSCVPATGFETSGGKIEGKDISDLLERNDIKYLSEMMNFPGVIYEDKEVISKINIAKSFNKPIDGHAPGLTGKSLERYVGNGITTDHECSTLKEALEKIKLGMKILIREGSAARNLEALKDLYRKYPEKIMLCSDDIHPEMLAERHINKIVARLFNDGYDLFDILRSCTLNPIEHYKLEAGMLREGDNADFIIVDDPGKMNVLETWIKGDRVFEKGTVMFRYSGGQSINNFICSEISESQIQVNNTGARLRIIQAFDGELFTKETSIKSGPGIHVKQDVSNDILKLVVKDRYGDAPPAVGFIKGFGLKKGAFASSVAHDSHNIICVGTNDEDIVSCINELVRLQGGLAVTCGKRKKSFKLNIGGIMSDNTCEKTATSYRTLESMARSMGCVLQAPFMTLSFMALLVIPELKISDKGLFDGTRFQPVPLFVE
jgi:adenine deaminase